MANPNDTSASEGNGGGQNQRSSNNASRSQGGGSGHGRYNGLSSGRGTNNQRYQGNGGGRGPNPNNKHHHRDTKAKFKGATEEMNGHIFQCPSETTDKNQYTRTFEELVRYARKELRHGQDIAYVLRNECDPTIPEPPDIPATATLGEQYKYKAKMEAALKRTEQLEENKGTIYSVILGQCSQHMENELKANEEFIVIDIDQTDCTKLLDIIRSIIYQYLSKQHTYSALLEAKVNLLSIKQESNETVLAYKERFDAAVKAVDFHGGAIANDLTLLAYELDLKQKDTTMLYRSRSAKEEKDVSEALLNATERMKAFIFLRGADGHRYGELKSNLHNNYLHGTDQYPSNTIKAFDVVMHYQNLKRGNASSSKDHKKKNGYRPNNNDGISGSSSASSNNNGNREDNAHPAQASHSSTSGGGNQSNFLIVEGDSNTTRYSDLPIDYNALDNSEVGFLQLEYDALFAQVKLKIIPASWVIIDSASTVSIIHQANLLTNIRGIPINAKPLHLHTNGGVQVTKQVGDLQGFGTVWYNPKSLANILSLAHVRRVFRVTYDSKSSASFFIHKQDGSKIELKEFSNGLYFFDTATDKSKTSVTDYCFIDTVANNKAQFSRRECDRADIARKVHALTGRQALPDITKYIRQGKLKNCPIGHEDMQRSCIIYGPAIPSLKGNTVRHQPQHVHEFIPTPLPRNLMRLHGNITLCADVVYIHKLPFLHTISRNIMFRTQQALEDRHHGTIVQGLQLVINMYHTRGFQVTTINADNEFRGIQADFPNIRVNACGADKHVPEIERSNCTLKERVRATTHALPFRYHPKPLIRGIVLHATSWLNAFPNKNSVCKTLSPREIITGRETDFNIDCQVEIGTYCQITEHNEPTNSADARTRDAIALHPTGNHQGSYFFMTLDTWERVSRNQWTELPMPSSIISRINLRGQTEGRRAINKLNTFTYEWRPRKPMFANEPAEDIDDDEYVPPANDDASDDEMDAATDNEGDTEDETNDDVDDTDNEASMNADDTVDKTSNVVADDNESGDLSDDTSNNTTDNAKNDSNVDINDKDNTLQDETSVAQSELEDNNSTTIEHAETYAKQSNTPDTQKVGTGRPKDVTTSSQQKSPRRSARLKSARGQRQRDGISTDNPSFNPDKMFEKRGYNLRRKNKQVQDRLVDTTQHAFMQLGQNPTVDCQQTVVSSIVHHLFLQNDVDLNDLQQYSQPDPLNDNATLPTEPPPSIGFSDVPYKKGIEIFGEKAIKAIIKEVAQLDDKSVFHAIDASKLSIEERKAALRALTFVKQKRCGKVKARTCADGRGQRKYYDKAESASPTVSIEGLLLTLAIDAIEGRDVATADIAGAYLNAEMDDFVLLKFDGEMVNFVLANNPEYEQFIMYEYGKKVLYMQLDKALYGCLKSAILWYNMFAGFLKDNGFEINPYDLCVANKNINGKQCTICWYVDDLKISHVDSKVVDNVISMIEERFTKMNVTRGTKHVYVGCNIEFMKNGEVQIDNIDYLKECIEAFGEDVSRHVNTPAGRELMTPKSGSPLLGKEKSEIFQSITMKLLWICKRSRPDLETSLSFLCTRTHKSTDDDWRKLKRVLRFVNKTLYDKRIISASSLGRLSMWVDASYAVHEDMRSHTGAVVSIGKGTVYCSSSKQKLNVKSSTEGELVGCSDKLPQGIWSRYFLECQGYNIKEFNLGQDNTSAMLLEENGMMSAGQKSRHINICYFFVKDRIENDRITLVYCPTEIMLADFFTKPLQGSLFQKMRKVIMGYIDVDELNVSKTKECVGNNVLAQNIGDHPSTNIARLQENITWSDVVRGAHKRKGSKDKRKMNQKHSCGLSHSFETIPTSTSLN